VFVSDATNLVPGDTNGYADIFVRDRDTDGDGIFDKPGEVATTRVSVDSSGNQGDGACGTCVISADGRFVAFESDSRNLVSGDTNGRRDIFVHDRATGATTRVSVSSSGEQANQDCWIPSFSADGRLVAFESTSTNLVLNDLNGRADCFVHDRDTAETALISLSSAGGQGNSESHRPAISGDGRSVGFDSMANNLVPDDTNGEYDVFVRDRIQVSFEGVPSFPNNANFTVSNAIGETGSSPW
jgi:Tol biopolymer transport system component